MKDEQVALRALLEFLNAVEDGLASAKRVIGEAKQVQGEFPEEPYDALVWTDGQGAKGQYQMASALNNTNSDLYRHLDAILRKNNGRFSDKSWKHYYWLGQEGDAIFRRMKSSSTKLGTQRRKEG